MRYLFVRLFDPDLGEVTFQARQIAGQSGGLALAADGAWTYTLNNALPAVQALNIGQSLVDQLTVKSFDGTTAGLQITINRSLGSRRNGYKNMRQRSA